MQTEATVAAWLACVRACRVIANDTDMKTCNAANHRLTHPMNCVDWVSSGAFCL